MKQRSGIKAFTLSLLMLLALSTVLPAQDSHYSFEANTAIINYRGEKLNTALVPPAMVNIDFDAGTVRIETNNAEIIDLLGGNLTLPIARMLGEPGPQYTLLLDGNIFMHVYLRRRTLIFTRNDMHPLHWGIQFTEVN